MSKLIIVCGAPGSGKTTLARELSKKLGIVCLHKDSIKEQLYESMKMTSLEDSKKIGKPSVDIMLRLAKEQIKNGVDIIIESPFYFEEDYDLFRFWQEKYNLDIYSVACSIDEKTRQKRFSKRGRHQAHHDTERDFKIVDYDYSSIPEEQIFIKTNAPTEKLVDEIVKKIKN